MSAFIDERREDFGVELVCRTLGVSASAYYARRSGPPSRRAVKDARLLALIRQLHAANYCAYGSRRMWKALLRAGETVGRGRVERLMRANGIQGAKRRGKPWRTTIPNAAHPRHPDLVQRDFTASRPDELWLADFTYLRCQGRLLFFSFVIDACSRMIVGWQFSTSMRTGLVLDALRMALTRREAGADVQLIHHSDAGRNTPASASPRSSPITACWARSDRSATPTTTPWPRASPATFKTELIADRRWRRPASSSSRSSHGSPGSTTTACTPNSATSRPPSTKPSTLPGPREAISLETREETNKHGLRETVRMPSWRSARDLACRETGPWCHRWDLSARAERRGPADEGRPGRAERDLIGTCLRQVPSSLLCPPTRPAVPPIRGGQRCTA